MLVWLLNIITALYCGSIHFRQDHFMKLSSPLLNILQYNCPETQEHRYLELVISIDILCMFISVKWRSRGKGRGGERAIGNLV